MTAVDTHSLWSRPLRDGSVAVGIDCGPLCLAPFRGLQATHRTLAISQSLQNSSVALSAVHLGYSRGILSLSPGEGFKVGAARVVREQDSHVLLTTVEGFVYDSFHIKLLPGGESPTLSTLTAAVTSPRETRRSIQSQYRLVFCSLPFAALTR